MNHYVMVTLLGLLIRASTGSAADTQTTSEPSVDGKRISVWLDEYQRSIPVPERDGEPQIRAGAEAAVRKIGTNAIPWLLQELSAKEVAQGDELPTNFTSGKASGRRWLAATAFEILGSVAKSATLKLVPLLDDEQTSYTAAMALGGIGTGSIPVLTQALTNQHACARESAARVLGLFGAEAQSAIPALIRCAVDKNDSVRGFAIFSLGQIGQEPDIVVPALIASLRDSYHPARWNATCALGKFGGRARPAIPALLQALKGDDAEVRDIAADSLRKIDPQAASEAGAK